MLNIEKISPEVSPRIRDATPESIPNYWGLTPEKFNFIHSYINPLDLETQLEFRPINYKGEEIYMLLNLLGEGSIGSVYYSEDYLKIDRENQITAAKFPHPMKLKQIKFDSVDIIRHTEIQAILNNEYKYHENLCQKKGEVFLSKRHYRHVFNECRTIKYAWFGMPMVPGQDLKTYMENIHNKSRSNKNENHNHSLFEMMVILLKIFLRIGETHDENWVHMDIKLDNVVHDKKSGDVNLIDFGLVHKKNQPFIVDMAKSHSFRADLKQYDKARFWMDLSALGLLLKEMLRNFAGIFNGVREGEEDWFECLDKISDDIKIPLRECIENLTDTNSILLPRAAQEKLMRLLPKLLFYAQQDSGLSFDNCQLFKKTIRIFLKDYLMERHESLHLFEGRNTLRDDADLLKDAVWLDIQAKLTCVVNNPSSKQRKHLSEIKAFRFLSYQFSIVLQALNEQYTEQFTRMFATVRERLVQLNTNYPTDKYVARMMEIMNFKGELNEDEYDTSCILKLLDLQWYCSKMSGVSNGFFPCTKEAPEYVIRFMRGIRRLNLNMLAPEAPEGSLDDWKLNRHTLDNFNNYLNLSEPDYRIRDLKKVV